VTDLSLTNLIYNTDLKGKLDMKQYYMSIDFFLNEKLSCRRETARCFVSLNISLRCGS